MKAMSKGKILKKLKTIKAIGYLKPDKILQSTQLSGYFTNLPLKLNTNALTTLAPVQEEPNKFTDSHAQVQEMEFDGAIDDKENIIPRKNYQDMGLLKENSVEIRVTKKKIESLEVDDCREPNKFTDSNVQVQETEYQEMEFDGAIDDKENIIPRKDYQDLGLLKENSVEMRVTKKKIESLEVDDCRAKFSSEIDVSNYRRPDLDSGTLFDPDLLAAFEQAVMEARAREEERRVIIEEEIMKDITDEELSLQPQNLEEYRNPLLDFEENCPPGGSESVIFYTTSLRGIRKTFEDCHSVRFLLESFRVLFYERDISMHSEYREELWKVLDGKVLPPRLFIKGRYIGGSEKILTLHEQGKFRPLFDGISVDETRGFCDSCGGVRFVMCFNCSGSKKIVCEEDGKQMRCPKCNENGVIVCPLCC